MSLSIALQNALSGLQTNEAVIQTIANNVANANVEGYTRKTSAPVSLTVAGEGRGVEAGALERVVDERLIEDMRQAFASFGDAQAQEFYFSRILSKFGTLADDSSLGATISNLATAMQELAASPDSSAHRANVLNAGVALADQLNELSREIQTLRFDADREIGNKITVINAEIDKIASLNEKIAGAQALGEATGELEDVRDQAINKLSGLLDVRYFRRTSGELVVTLPDGRVLADSNAHPLTYDPSGSLTADITYAGGGIGPILLGVNDVTSSIKSGELHGLIEARDQFLPDLQAQLDQLTQSLRNELNAIHNDGTSRPAPNTLTGTRNFSFPATDTITLSADVRIAAVDQNGDFLAYFDLAAGTYTIAQIESQIDTNLSGYATASTSNDGPLSITASGSTNGIAIADLSDQTITHTDGATTYKGFSNYLGLNDFFVTPGRVQGESISGIASFMQVRSDIIGNPALMVRGALNAETSPAPTFGSAAVTLGDATVMQRLADKFIDKVQYSATGGLPLTNISFAGYASEILSTAAITTSSLEKSADFTRKLLQEISYRNESISGVNIDEELRNLVLYENAYAATARIVSVIDDLFEQLIDITR